MPIRLTPAVGNRIRKIRKLPSEIFAWTQWKMHILMITLKSLFYTQRLSFSYMVEVFMEPMVWIVDHFTKVLGPILVAGVIILTSTIVYIVYWLGLPHYRDKRPYWYAVLMPYGHWLLLNVIFHFYMACLTEPGTPMKASLVTEVVGVCKKCVAPKPPRTHHCSVCNKCILKMDHHCPWINSCVGHYNHRYFFMYMVFMILGCSFIIIFGAEIAYNEMWLGESGGPALRDTAYRLLGYDPHPLQEGEEEELQGYPVRRNATHLFKVVNGEAVEGVNVLEEERRLEEQRRATYWLRFAITYAGLLTVGACSSLGVLATWHARLISRGETSVEQLINKKERERLGKLGQVYKNPYHFGRLENWRIFLGIQKGSGRSFIRHVLLPSTHPPLGTGLSWPTRYHDCNSTVNRLEHQKQQEQLLKQQQYQHDSNSSQAAGATLPARVAAASQLTATSRTADLTTYSSHDSSAARVDSVAAAVDLGATPAPAPLLLPARASALSSPEIPAVPPVSSSYLSSQVDESMAAVQPKFDEHKRRTCSRDGSSLGRIGDGLAGNNHDGNVDRLENSQSSHYKAA